MIRPSIILLAVLFLIKSTQSCPSLSGVTIANLRDDVSFVHVNESNLSDSEISVTYSWDVTVEEDNTFDGFVYKFVDTDDYTRTIMKQASISKPSSGMTPDRCNSLPNRSLWVTDKNGSYVECKIPCTRELGPTCFPGASLCPAMTEFHHVLKKNVRNLTFEINYGRHYTFEIFPYRGLYTTEDVAYHDKTSIIDKVFLFCGHHLVETQGIAKGTAYNYCSSMQNISEMILSSGPPANISVVSVYNNNEDHTATIVIRWRPPYDIRKDSRVTTYFIKTNFCGEANPNSVRAKTPEEEREDPYYNVSISQLQYNTKCKIEIRPVASAKESCSYVLCPSEGQTAEFTYELQDLDACATPEDPNQASYCAEEATCQDAPAGSPFVANCTCGPGYVGNGVREIWKGGKGCIDFNACLDVNSTFSNCSDLAHCVDDKPPEMGYSCRCPDNYYGNGLRNGSGCTFRWTILIAVVVSVSIMLMFSSIYVVWKCKIMKREKIEQTMSKFVSIKSSAYSPPLVIPNFPVFSVTPRQVCQNGPVFGAKWELNRADIQQQGVIGRGNFGVVHRATLNKDGSQKAVAVKSLTGAYATCHREDFLAEMALLLSLGSHDNVLGIIGVCTSTMTPDDESSSPLLVTEFMPYGDLLHFLWGAREVSKREADPIYNFTEISLYNIGQQVANGLHFLSSSKIIHGDVAARNILVGEDLQCKISDFGLANDVYRYGMIKGATERRVPFKWVSPERMMGGSVPITWRSDVWSFGILLYEMVTLGAAPYPSMNPRTIFQTLKDGYRMPCPASCSEHIYNIMLECWCWNAIQRPTFSQLRDQLTSALLRHSNAVLASQQRALCPIDDFDLQRYEADIGKRDDESGTCCEDSVPLAEQCPPFATANGDQVAANVTTNGVQGKSFALGSDTQEQHTIIANGHLSSLWTGDIFVRLDSDSEESEETS